MGILCKLADWIESKLEGEPVSPEYEAGFVAGLAGNDDNPHPVGTQAHSDWMLGYVDGDMAWDVIQAQRTQM